MSAGHAKGFPPVTGKAPWLLVLGSLPGQRSIDAGRYYAHPRNAFWPVAGRLFGFDPADSYALRCAALTGAGVALWDVLASSKRAGSLDAAIDLASARCNDFDAFLGQHPTIRLVACNGRKAATLFERKVLPTLTTEPPPVLALPSTSPAHASLTQDEKAAEWSQVLAWQPAASRRT